jgi:hypothetical protein
MMYNYLVSKQWKKLKIKEAVSKPMRAPQFFCNVTYNFPLNFDMLQVLGYPSKPIGLFIRRSIIFRSDSNGEDLEGYAGAGLYDR